MSIYLTMYETLCDDQEIGGSEKSGIGHGFGWEKRWRLTSVWIRILEKNDLMILWLSYVHKWISYVDDNQDPGRHNPS